MYLFAFDRNNSKRGFQALLVMNLFIYFSFTMLSLFFLYFYTTLLWNIENGQNSG